MLGILTQNFFVKLFQGNYEKLKEIWSLLELSQTKPNIQAYAAAFECLINKKEPSSNKILQELSKQFFSEVWYQIYVLKCIIILLLFICLGIFI